MGIALKEGLDLALDVEIFNFHETILLHFFQFHPPFRGKVIPPRINHHERGLDKNLILSAYESLV